jgi:hypothetical protein
MYFVPVSVHLCRFIGLKTPLGGPVCYKCLATGAVVHFFIVNCWSSSLYHELFRSQAGRVGLAFIRSRCIYDIRLPVGPHLNGVDLNGKPHHFVNGNFIK